MTFIERIESDPFLASSRYQEEFFDELTGTISRRHILRYIHYLIGNHIPFTMGILDMDNFKLVNDTYGHATGDHLLKQFGRALCDYIAPYGVVGRYGGDEFILIDLKHHRYDEVKKFYCDMYNSDRVVRCDYYIGDNVFHVTATTGTATFSRDSREYEGLFEKADKALYKGKTKGRNCYVITIYNQEGDSEKDYDKLSTYDFMDSISSVFAVNKKMDKLIEEALRVLQKNLDLSLAFYVDENARIYSSKCKGVNKVDSQKLLEIDRIFGNEKIIEYSNISRFKGEKNILINELLKNQIDSFIIKKVYIGENPYGYIGFFTINDNRIWQNDDKVLLTFLEKIIGFARLHNIS